MTNIEEVKKINKEVIQFIENERKENKKIFELHYLQIRGDAISTLSNLSNFLIAVSTILLSISLNINSDSDNLNNKPFLIFSLIFSIVTLLSIIFGLIHGVLSFNFFNKIMNNINLKVKNTANFKVNIFKDHTTAETKEVVNNFYNINDSFKPIDEENSKDMNLIFLYLQMSFLILAFIIALTQIVYLIR